MKSVKVFFMGQPLREVYPHATRWQVFKYKVREFVRKTTIVSMGGVAMYGMYFVGLQQAQIEYVRGDTVEILREVQMPVSAPVLERIKQAESKGNQFCTEELAKAKKFKGCFAGRVGMPLMGINTDGTVDWGICQINDYHWGAKARELGYDIMTQEGNIKMCEWIFLNHGTDPWNSSKANW